MVNKFTDFPKNSCIILAGIFSILLWGDAFLWKTMYTTLAYLSIDINSPYFERVVSF